MSTCPSGDGGILLYRQRCHWDLVSQFLAGRSDKRGDRKSLMSFAAC